MAAMRLGVITQLEQGPEQALADVQALGFATCQVSCWHPELLTSHMARRLRAAAAVMGIEVTTIWAGMPGRHAWDFLEGPTTIGLVPRATRRARLAALRKAARFARLAGVPSITTHVGFIPENLTDPLYPGIVVAVRSIATYCAGQGIEFWFETGQETPVTLLRVIEDVGTSNLGVNLDPANLLMYGRGNPLDALDVIGRYVRGVHAKDGEYPSDGRHLGQERPLGQGRVNFPLLVAKLKALGYGGALTIEREISGPQQVADIKQAKTLLEHLLQ